jgi:hypothetical protein
MTASGPVASPGVKVVRTRPDPIATFFLIATSLFLLLVTAILWRALLNQMDMEAAYEATLAETAERYRLLRLDPATLRQQIQATEQSLSDLRAAIPLAQDAQAELARYGLYATESGVSAESQLGETVRYISADPALPDVLAQRWKVEARGQMRDVIRFYERIAAGRFAAWRIENVVVRPDVTPGAGAWDVLAGADVVVYSYPP